MYKIEDIINKVHCADCLEFMKKMPENSIDLVVTSPPYDNLRDYKGYTFNFEGIANELYRIIKEGGVVVWVVGDATIKGSETGTSFRQALYFKEIGFNLHDTMIYQKLNFIPLTHNRYEQEFEYMFVLSKGKPKTFNPILKRNKLAGKKYNPSRPRDYDNNAIRHNRSEIRVFNEFGRVGNIFGYIVGAGNEITNHPATFPEQLVLDHIISWSNEGYLILDPMCGSGTTCKMARILNRNFIGIDISEDYCKIAQARIKAQPQPLKI